MTERRPASATEPGRGRSLKRRVLGLLQASDFDNSLREILLVPGRQVVNPLFSLLMHSNEIVRWRAVRAMGSVIAGLARTNIEDARIIMRRLMWSLNDESGGIGWGAPEVIGEALSQSERLAQEYSAIFVSYADERGNFLEHDGLQRGLMWAWERLAQVRPSLLQASRPLLNKYLESNDPTIRGLAALTAGLLKAQEAITRLKAMAEDDSHFSKFFGDQLAEMRVKDAAREALEMICLKKCETSNAASHAYEQ